MNASPRVRPGIADVEQLAEPEHVDDPPGGAVAKYERELGAPPPGVLAGLQQQADPRAAQERDLAQVDRHAGLAPAHRVVQRLLDALCVRQVDVPVE